MLTPSERLRGIAEEIAPHLLIFLPENRAVIAAALDLAAEYLAVVNGTATPGEWMLALEAKETALVAAMEGA